MAPIIVKSCEETRYARTLYRSDKVFRMNLLLTYYMRRAFPPKSEKRQRCALSPLPFHTELETVSRTIRQEKEIERIHIRK